MSCTLWPEQARQLAHSSAALCLRPSFVFAFVDFISRSDVVGMGLPFLRASSSSRLLFGFVIFFRICLIIVVLYDYRTLAYPRNEKAPFLFDTIVQALFVVILFSGHIHVDAPGHTFSSNIHTKN